MKSLIKKIVKPLAIGVFFMALFFNVKVSLENPFIRMDNAALAQTSSSGGEGEGELTCYYTITTSEGHQVRYCGTCSFIDNSAASWVSGSGKC